MCFTALSLQIVSLQHPSVAHVLVLKALQCSVDTSIYMSTKMTPLTITRLSGHLCGRTGRHLCKCSACRPRQFWCVPNSWHDPQKTFKPFCILCKRKRGSCACCACLRNLHPRLTFSGLALCRLHCGTRGRIPPYMPLCMRTIFNHKAYNQKP